MPSQRPGTQSNHSPRQNTSQPPVKMVSPDRQTRRSAGIFNTDWHLCVHSHTYCHHYDKGLILAIAPVLCFVLATVCSFTQTISDLMIKNKIEMLSIATACAAVRTRNNQVVNLLWYIPGQQEFTSRRKSLLARSAANAREQFNSGVVYSIALPYPPPLLSLSPHSWPHCKEVAYPVNGPFGESTRLDYFEYDITHHEKKKKIIAWRQISATEWCACECARGREHVF